MQLTTRDKETLNWINQFGAVTIHQLAAKWCVKPKTAYGRILKLVRNHYLTHHQLLYGEPGVYRVTANGAETAESELPPLRHMRLATLRHDLAIVDVGLRLTQQHGGTFVSERQLRHERCQQGVGVMGHLSDGEYKTSNHKRIAIEVELSKKGKRRREQIVQHYMNRLEINEVWYFSDNREVVNQLAPYVRDLTFMQCFLLSDFLQTGEFIHAVEKCKAVS